jgi:hypothetical protein
LGIFFPTIDGLWHGDSCFLDELEKRLELAEVKWAEVAHAGQSFGATFGENRWRLSGTGGIRH